MGTAKYIWYRRSYLFWRKTMNNGDSCKTIEDVWAWRKKAYGEIENLPEAERIKRISSIGRKYSEKLHLRRCAKEVVT
jgi:hypothetical protein